MSIHDVGLLVNLRLGYKSHLAFVRGLGPLAPVGSMWDTPAPVPNAGNRGYLLGLWVIGWVLSALKLNISIFHRVKVSKVSMVGINQRLRGIKRGVPDPILEPEGLEALSKRRNPILLEVCMLVMLLNVKVHIFVKIEVLAVALIPEGLQLGRNGVPGQDNLLSAKEKCVQGPVNLLPILSLAELLHMAPPARFTPTSMEDIVNHDHISQETGLKRSVTLDICWEVTMNS